MDELKSLNLIESFTKEGLVAIFPHRCGNESICLSTSRNRFKVMSCTLDFTIARQEHFNPTPSFYGQNSQLLSLHL